MDVMHCLTNDVKYHELRQTTDTKIWLVWLLAKSEREREETLVFEPWSVEAAWPSENTDQGEKKKK
jgi:hypothetical protein